MKNLTLELDNKAKGLAKDYLRAEAALLGVLMEMRGRRVFAQLNCSGIYDYCSRILKLSEAQSYYFKSVAETSERVPELKKAVTQGELSLSQARRIAPVITSQNQQHWIDKAKTLPQAALEKQVTAANPHARPREKIKPVAHNLSELKVPISEKTEQDLMALKEIVSQKLKRAATLSNVIAFAAKEARERHDPEQAAQRAEKLRQRKEEKQKIDEAQQSRKFSSEKEVNKKLGANETEMGRKFSSGRNVSEKPKHASGRNVSEKPKHASIDSQVAGGRHIPHAVKHSVVLRQGFQCAHKAQNGIRCSQRRWLHYHHIKEIAKGGNHTASNLILLCSTHHAALHAHKINLREADSPQAYGSG